MVTYILYADSTQEVVIGLREHFAAAAERAEQKFQRMRDQAKPKYSKKQIEAAKAEHTTLSIMVVDFLNQLRTKPSSEAPPRSPVEEVKTKK